MIHVIDKTDFEYFVKYNTDIMCTIALKKIIKQFLYWVWVLGGGLLTIMGGLILGGIGGIIGGGAPIGICPIGGLIMGGIDIIGGAPIGICPGGIAIEPGGIAICCADGPIFGGGIQTPFIPILPAL